MKAYLLLFFSLAFLPMYPSAQVKRVSIQIEVLDDSCIPENPITSFEAIRLNNSVWYLLGEDHEVASWRVQAGVENAKKMYALFQEADELDEEHKYHLLIEQQFEPLKFGRYKRKDLPLSIGQDIIFLAKSGKIQRAKVENIELRKVSGAAVYLISKYLERKLKNIDFEAFSDNRKEDFHIVFGTDITKVTFQDTITAFEKNVAQIKKMTDRWQDPAICALFAQVYEELEKGIKSFRYYIKTGGLWNDEMLHDIKRGVCIESMKSSKGNDFTSELEKMAAGSQRIFDPQESILGWLRKDTERLFVSGVIILQNRLIYCYALLLDAYAMHRALKISRREVPVEKILFYGGAAHVRSIKKFLIEHQVGEDYLSTLEVEEGPKVDPFEFLKRPIKLEG